MTAKKSDGRAQRIKAKRSRRQKEEISNTPEDHEVVVLRSRNLQESAGGEKSKTPKRKTGRSRKEDYVSTQRRKRSDGGKVYESQRSYILLKYMGSAEPPLHPAEVKAFHNSPREGIIPSTKRNRKRNRTSPPDCNFDKYMLNHDLRRVLITSRFNISKTLPFEHARLAWFLGFQKHRSFTLNGKSETTNVYYAFFDTLIQLQQPLTDFQLAYYDGLHEAALGLPVFDVREQFIKMWHASPDADIRSLTVKQKQSCKSFVGLVQANRERRRLREDVDSFGVVQDVRRTSTRILDKENLKVQNFMQDYLRMLDEHTPEPQAPNYQASIAQTAMTGLQDDEMEPIEAGPSGIGENVEMEMDVCEESIPSSGARHQNIAHNHVPNAQQEVVSMRLKVYSNGALQDRVFTEIFPLDMPIQEEQGEQPLSESDFQSMLEMMTKVTLEKKQFQPPVPAEG